MFSTTRRNSSENYQFSVGNVDEEAEEYLISNTQIEDYRATVSKIKVVEKEGVVITSELMDLLQLNPNDNIRCIPLKSPPK